MTIRLILIIQFAFFSNTSYCQKSFPSDSIKVIYVKKGQLIFMIGDTMIGYKRALEKMDSINDFEVDFYTKKVKKINRLKSIAGYTGSSLLGSFLALSDIDMKIRGPGLATGLALVVYSIFPGRAPLYFIKAVNRYNEITFRSRQSPLTN